jgi:hypothetical protein
MVGVPIVQIPLPLITLNLGDAITFFVVTFVLMACIYFALKYFLYTPLGRIWGEFDRMNLDYRIWAITHRHLSVSRLFWPQSLQGFQVLYTPC